MLGEMLCVSDHIMCEDYPFEPSKISLNPMMT